MNKPLVSTYVAIVTVTVAALILISFLDIAYPLSITTTSRTSELSVVGEGKVDVVPDIAHVDVGVSLSTLPTAEEAQKQLTDKNNIIILAIKKLGIKDENIKTINYSINPNYVYNNEAGRDQINGYSAVATISVRLTDTNLAPKVITSATAAGANQIGGIRFNIENPQKYRQQAREEAIENAKQEGQNLAKRLGIKLGKIVNIVETSPDPAGGLGMKSFTAQEGIGGPPEPDISSGTQTIISVVTLYFEKK